MRKPIMTMQALINNNKKEILSNKKEMAKIEKRIDDKHYKQLKMTTNLSN